MLIENGASVFPDIEVQAYREGLPVMIRGDAVCGDYSRGIVNAHVDCWRQLMVVRVLNVEVTGLIFRGRLRAKEVRPLIRAQSSISSATHLWFGMRRPEQCHSWMLTVKWLYSAHMLLKSSRWRFDFTHKRAYGCISQLYTRLAFCPPPQSWPRSRMGHAFNSASWK
jgi:hypothetical protein